VILFLLVARVLGHPAHGERTRMRRYFFHVAHRGEPILDDLGTELPDIEAACKEALSVCADMMKHHALLDSLWGGTTFRLWVTDHPDAAGKRLFMILFSMITD
jgi:hypothetical protein